MARWISGIGKLKLQQSNLCSMLTWGHMFFFVPRDHCLFILIPWDLFLEVYCHNKQHAGFSNIHFFSFLEIRTRNCTHDLITETVWLFIFIFFKSPHLPSLCILGCPLLPRITTFPSSVINSGQLFLWTWLIAAAWNEICWAEEVSPFSMVTWPECSLRKRHTHKLSRVLPAHVD